MPLIIYFDTLCATRLFRCHTLTLMLRYAMLMLLYALFTLRHTPYGMPERHAMLPVIMYYDTPPPLRVIASAVIDTPSFDDIYAITLRRHALLMHAAAAIIRYHAAATIRLISPPLS